MRSWGAWVGAAALLVACAEAAEERSSNDDDGAGASAGNGGTAGSVGGQGGVGGTAGAGGALTIPDPGASMDAWVSIGDISTPMLAWRVGTATMNAGYIEGTAGAVTSTAYFVFRAGPALTSFSGFVSGAVQPSFVHLHDGTGLVFGAEIAKTTPSPVGGTWAVTPGNVYVFEVNFPGGGFF